MGHPDNGQIQALLDGEIDGSEGETLRDHLRGCPECEARMAALETASRETTDALLLLDQETADRTPRFQKTRARFLARERGIPRGFFGSVRSLPKAASIALLLTGAAVTALPGSPVRQWIVQGWKAITQPVPTDPGQEDAGMPGGDPPVPSPGVPIPETGASILASSEGVEIWIHELPSEVELRVLWTDGDEAWIYAGEGTRFNLQGGRLEAFSPLGAVRVEIPRTLQEIVVGVNGRLLLRKIGGELEIVGPIRRRTPSEIIFEAPTSTNDSRG